MTIKTPPEVSAEVDRLAKICPPDHDVRYDYDGHKWTVYLKPSAPLVRNPQTEDGMNTYIKHMIRSGSIDLDRFVKNNKDGQSVDIEAFLSEYSNDDN